LINIFNLELGDILMLIVFFYIIILF